MTIGLPPAASESGTTWSTMNTSTEQESATSTTPTAIYGLLSSRISCAGFWKLGMGASLEDRAGPESDPRCALFETPHPIENQIGFDSDRHASPLTFSLSALLNQLRHQ